MSVSCFCQHVKGCQLTESDTEAKKIHSSEFGICLPSLLKSIFVADATVFVGITGRAGSGKTTLAGTLCEIARSLGVVAEVLSLDSFFILSSADRSQWLAEATPGSKEHEFRTNQMNWWNFEKLRDSLQALRSENRIHLEGIYNRADRGELTGNISIQLANNGTNLVLVEGVAIAHPQISTYFDHLWLVETPQEERKARLFNRDKSRRSNQELAEARFRITESFEQPYFAEFSHLASLKLLSQYDRFFPL